MRLGRIISRRKVFFLLFTGLLVLWLEKFVLTISKYHHNDELKAGYDLKVLDTARQWMEQSNLKNIKHDDVMVVNYGTIKCFHLGTKYERCLKPKHFHNKPRIVTNSITVRKDLRGSYGYNVVGISEYFFFEVVRFDEFLLYNKPLDVLVFDATPNVNLGTHHIPSATFKEISLVEILRDKFIDIISDVNILFGEDAVDPRPNWHLVKSSPYLSYKHPFFMSYMKLGSQEPEYTKSKVLVKKEHEDDGFKIVQLADLHLGVGKNRCLDEYPHHDKCEADSKTLKFVEEVLDIEKPGFVVFSGDQIMGDRSLQDSESVLYKAVDPVIRRRIPWAMVWGNHDDEGSLSRWELSKLAMELPYSRFQISPHDTKDNTFGVGNYAHQIFYENDPEVAALSLYFMDSHKYSKTGKIYPGYDWLKEEQLEYIQSLYERGMKSHIKENIHRHAAMTFIHIPLPEYLNLDSKKRPGESNELIGTFKEGVTAPRYNSGGLVALDKIGVDVVGCGHDHCNDYCLHDDSTSNKNIWLCYGGGAGEGGYAGYGGTERRIRTYKFDPQTGKITTWKRLNSKPSEIFDFQIVKD